MIKNGVCRTLLRSRLNQRVQPALGPSRCILVNHVFCRSLVESFCRHAILVASLVHIACLHCLADKSNVRPNSAFGGAILGTTLEVLTKSFLGAGSIWHGDREIREGVAS